jgi:eukaryotic-like serine/threonine-protein kinase
MKSVLGRGGMGTAYLATRHALGTSSSVVLKVIDPAGSGEEGDRAALAVQKEAVSLGRLNERVPATPYVVRLIDVGALELSTGYQSLKLPWVAVEYVHGGVDGTTLEERLEHSMARSGQGFAPDRAARAVRCLMLGVDAIHEVGVIHRDLKPPNVLCCGFGVDEVLKIADFGIARSKGMAATFGSASLGTPGYAAPEQTLDNQGPVSASVDIFAFGAVVFYLLTGEDLFNGDTVLETVLVSLRDERRSILECKGLAVELRSRPHACRAIDEAVAWATAAKASDRPPTASSVGRALIEALDEGPRSVRSSHSLVQSVLGTGIASRPETLTWSVLSHPDGARVARRAAWTPDGHCLVPTNHGLEFWDGAYWRRVADLPNGLPALGLVRTIGPDRWLLAGSAGLLGVYTSGAGFERLAPPSATAEILVCDGDPNDLMVAATRTPGQPSTLTAMAAQRWVRPVPLPPDAIVNDVARIDDGTWFVCGRHRSGAAFAALYDPLWFQLEPLPTPCGPLVACAANIDRSLGVAVGRHGAFITVSSRTPQASTIPGAPDVASAAMDVTGQLWAGTTGELLTHRPGGQWVKAWQGEWKAPFISLQADVGVVRAMTADGGILEGRVAAH